MSQAPANSETGRLRAKLDRERVNVRKLVDVKSRLLMDRAAWHAERGVLQRRLAVLQSQHHLLLADREHVESSGVPIRILVVGRVRKTIVEFLSTAVVTQDSTQGPFDLLVIPRPEKQDLDRIAREIPESVWSAVRMGQTRLILDGSSEGHVHRLVLEQFRSLAEQTGVPLRETIYLIQDRLAAQPSASVGRRFEIPLPVINYDYHLHKTLWPMLKHGEAVFREGFDHYSRAARRGRRAFLSLNFSPRAHRVLLLARLLRDGLWNDGFISFGGFGAVSDDDVQAGQLAGRIDWRGFEAAQDEAAPWVPGLHRKGAILFGMPEVAGASGSARRLLRARGLHEYRRSWFSVVTETEMRADILRVTEKTLKPVLNFHPFALLGNPGALRLIKSYGLQTFPELFDESYDDEEDTMRRFDLVYDQVRRLARMEEAELDRLEASVAEKVIFNAHWALTRLPRLFQATLLPAAIERMLPRRSVGPARAPL